MMQETYMRATITLQVTPAEAIHVLRRRHEVDMDELAERAKVHRNTVSAIENGFGKASTVDHIRRVLDEIIAEKESHGQEDRRAY